MEGLFPVGSTKKMTYGDTKDLGQLHDLGYLGVRSSLFNPNILAHPNTKLRGNFFLGQASFFSASFYIFLVGHRQIITISMACSKKNKVTLYVS